MLIERARAKVNLSLHIIGRRADGYHDLESLVAFAGAGDLLSLEPGDATTLAVSGSEGAQLNATRNNLVMRAATEFSIRVDASQKGDFHLVKRLPVASGIGGGSADAAATLRLLARANGLPRDDQRLFDVARSLGADVPVCVDARARMMRGVGDQLDAPLKLPPLFAILVNPRVAVETAGVFKGLNLKPGEQLGYGKHPHIDDGMSFDALIGVLRRARNDLEDAAITTAPVISHVLAVIGAARGCRLARMSGSGATCFGLFETCAGAAKAARVIRRDHPSWWTRSTILR